MISRAPPPPRLFEGGVVSDSPRDTRKITLNQLLKEIFKSSTFRKKGIFEVTGLR